MIEDIGPRPGDAPAMLNEEGPWGPGEDKTPGDRKGGERRNPWLQPPSRKPRAPKEGGQPSLEELIRRGRDRFAGLPGGGRPIWGYAIVAFVALWLFSTSLHRIAPQDVGVITRFGRYAGLLKPGVGLTLPAPIDVVTPVDVEKHRSFGEPASGGANLLLTRDQDLVNLTYTVNWSVRDPDVYLFNLPSDPEPVLRDAAQAAMREAVAGMDLDRIVSGDQSDLAARVAARTQQLLDRYHAGVLVQGVSIRQAGLPAELADSAKGIDDAKAAVQAETGKARDDVSKDIADAKVQTQLFDQAYDAYKLAPQVTRSRMYYDMMEAILARSGRVIVDAPNVTVQVPPPPGKKPQPQAQAQQGGGQ
jgi:membrane protease subunit HflK